MCRPGALLLLLACAACTLASCRSQVAGTAAQSDNDDSGVWRALEALEDQEDIALPTLNGTDLLFNISAQAREEFLKCHAALLEEQPPDHCGPSFDTFLCWLPQPADTLAKKPCFEELNEVYYVHVGRFATRYCLSNSTWEPLSNYSACLEARPISERSIEVTTTIYYAGYTVSTVALTAAVVIFSYFGELNCLRNRIHMNLMLAYIGADLVWILNLTVNVYLTDDISLEFCYVLIVLLHYTMLTHFLWMFVEGLYLYTLVVKTFQQGTVRLPVYLVIGWGAPVVFVVAWVLTRLLLPLDEEGTSQNLNSNVEMEKLEEKCPWMVSHWSDWIYQAPCIAVLGVNCIFLVFVMYVLITKLRSEGTLRAGQGGAGPRPTGDSEQQQSRKAAKALLVLIPLLGITYVLVIAGPTEGRAADVFAKVRALLLSTQGLHVALFYCFLNTDVRHALRTRWKRWREMRMIGRQRDGRAPSVNWTHRDT